ncbi:hypothetical protein G9A89_020888 [Geosiphon pyriformis]|nr:hypothetical protein G9A89_020888 [Geosiphon pyriformis]
MNRQLLFQVKGFPTFDDDARVNKLFLETIEPIFPRILENIHEFLKKSPKAMEIFFVGHAIRGAPRIGNSRFSRFANGLIKHHRITHGNDHVPHSPSDPLNWNHFGSEVWIEPLENCNCLDDVNFHPYSYWDCNNQFLQET